VTNADAVEVGEGVEAGAVERGRRGVGRAEGDEQHRAVRDGPLFLVGTDRQGRSDEGVAVRVDVVGVRLHGSGDQDDRPWRAARERVDVERDVLGGQPGREPLVVGGVAGGGPQAVEDVGHVLLVALPGDVGGGELHERARPLVGQHPRRVGADVAEQHVGPVAVEGGAGLWQDVDALVEEAGHARDGVVRPRLAAVFVG